jgi:glyoxylase-like metal-dependent hydrolase (beta-lactamase superfamily II)
MLLQMGEKLFIVFNEDGYTYGNCILVDDDIRVVIDSGAGRELAKVQPENVDMLINTHHHYDHVRGNKLFTRAQILLHPVERISIKSLEKVMAIDGWKELMHQDLYNQERMEEGVDPDAVTEQWRVDGEINDGQVIDCGSTKFVVLHTPGHSKGHCAFYFPDEDLVFLGDICLTRVIHIVFNNLKYLFMFLKMVSSAYRCCVIECLKREKKKPPRSGVGKARQPALRMADVIAVYS